MRAEKRKLTSPTWTTLMTQQRERGRETMMRRQESKVIKRAQSPGPSSQAEMGIFMKMAMLKMEWY